MNRYFPWIAIFTLMLVHSCDSGTQGPSMIQDDAAGKVDTRGTGDVSACDDCPEGTICVGGSCVCAPDCKGRDCGDDGCGGSCGTCQDQLSCTTDLCDKGACTYELQPYSCLIQETCVAAGVPNPANECEACLPATAAEDWTIRVNGVVCGSGDVCWEGACCPRTANCQGKDCGDDGCGSVCGGCLMGWSCVEGICQVEACEPDCDGKECGSDGCAGYCGFCPLGWTCAEGLCVCPPDCDEKECGDDGCGGSCGNCGEGYYCAGNQCLDGPCVPDCAGKSCGDDGCGGSCGGCDDGLFCTVDLCQEGLCEHGLSSVFCLIEGSCVPSGSPDPDNPCRKCLPATNPEGWSDAPDGLACAPDKVCQTGQCVDPVCEPDCAGKDCGPDGCGQLCGSCAEGFLCDGGICVEEPCVSDCAGKTCGDDGCGGSCGTCDDGLFCTVDQCDGGLCTSTLSSVYCVINGECVPSGTVDPMDPCQSCQPGAASEGWTGIPDGLTCEAGKVCYQGSCCDKAGHCQGKDCGDDGCGGTCGACPDNYLCQGGTCVEGVCAPACAGKDCGDDGCGGSCGSCDDGLFCTVDVCEAGGCSSSLLSVFCVIDGDCVPSGAENPANPCEKCDVGVSQAGWSAAPDGLVCAGGKICHQGTCCDHEAHCAGKECGDDGCGDVCGTCAVGFLCEGGLCVEEGVCVPSCSGKDCGDDGCGGSCGICDDGLFCTVDACDEGACDATLMSVYCLIGGECVPSGSVDPDDSCQSCQPAEATDTWSPVVDGVVCAAGQVCYQGSCCDKATHCQGKGCGDDGCGGTCGTCPADFYCVAGVCQEGGCVPECMGKECGEDGCGGSCGTCEQDETCLNGHCEDAGQPDSCFGHCGGAAETCYCDDLCFVLDICCDDICVACPDLEGCTCGNGACNTAGGENCDTCPEDCGCGCGEACEDGVCVSVLCEGKECGPDGCGGSCGGCSIPPGAACVTGVDCVEGLCELEVQSFYCVVEGVCVPSGTENPDNPCQKCLPSEAQVGWSALPDDTPCGSGLACHAGTCCDYDCEGKQCGDDGCGGVCGVCPAGLLCSQNDLCDGCDDGNSVDWDGCTDSVITEFQMNAYWTGDQWNSRLAVLENDGFVGLWQHEAGGTASHDNNARLFDSSGAPVGVEFLTTPSAAGQQYAGEAAALPDGGFMVVWYEQSEEDNMYDVFAQRFAADGAKIGDAFLVNIDLDKDNSSPQVAVNASGELVVAWYHDGYTMYGRRFQPDGTPLGMGVMLQQSVIPYAVVPLADGGVFVAGYRTYDKKIGGRYYDQYLVAQGGWFYIDNTDENQYAPHAALLADSEVLVVWGEKNRDGNFNGVFAREVSGPGVMAGETFQVNTTTQGNQQTPDVVGLSDGHFVVVWANEELDGGYNIYMRKYAADATPLGGEVVVNTYTVDYQVTPVIDVFSDDSFMVAYHSGDGQDGHESGVFAQRFSADGYRLYR